MPILIVWVKAKQVIPSQFKTEPTAGHARCDLEQVGYDPFVQTEYPFLCYDGTNCMAD